MYAISVNQNFKANQVSSRTHFVRADSNLVGFFIGDKMKTCSKCKQSKSLSEFHKNRSKKDGLESCCKSCTRKTVAKYQQTEKCKVVIAKYRETPKQKAVQRKAIAKHSARNPNYPKAIYTVNHAVTAGKLPRPNSLQCHYCPKPAQQYHHWHGYEKEHWLDVVAVCRNCHTKLHKKINYE